MIPVDIIIEAAVAGIRLAVQGVTAIVNAQNLDAEQKAKAIERIQREAEVIDQAVQSFKVHPFRGDANLDGHG